MEMRVEEKGGTEVGREEGRRKGGGWFKGVSARRQEGAERVSRGKKLWAAFLKAPPGSSAPLWVTTTLLGPPFAARILPRNWPVRWESLDVLGRPSKIWLF